MTRNTVAGWHGKTIAATSQPILNFTMRQTWIFLRFCLACLASDLNAIQDFKLSGKRYPAL
jgi:hypothetical protein